MLEGFDPNAERRLRELLYHCLEELGATKAALYLEGNQGSFELAAQYGFGRRDSIAAEVKPGSPLWDWIRRNRTSPTFSNDVTADPGLAKLLESAGTSRLLTIPLTVSNRLVGLVDARDKARRLPYGGEDVPIARSIGAAIEGYLREIGLFGPAQAAAPGVPAAPAVAAATAAAADDANATPLHAAGIEATTALVRTLAAMPGISSASITVTDGKAVRSAVFSAAALDPRQREALANHQAQRLLEAGLRVPAPARWSWSEETTGARERNADEIRTALLHEGPPLWVVLSVLTPGGGAAAEPVLAAARSQLALATQLRAYRRAARNLARVLLEPGEASFPHLKQHSQAVSELSQRISAALGLPEQDEELVTVAAYLHDVGMRELDYARIYRLERPGESERKMYQRHPVVGARIVEGAEFPNDLAAAIRHHHERWDGQGYPQRLAGRAIPLAARIVHIAEVWDTLTSSSSYRRPLGREQASEQIRGEAGRQFDPDLVPVLLELVRS